LFFLSLRYYYYYCIHNTKHLSPVLAMFFHDCPLAVRPANTPWRLLPEQTWRGSLHADMLISSVCVLVVALSSSEVPEGLTNCPVLCTNIINSKFS
jgi:hypothetical protein